MRTQGRRVQAGLFGGTGPDLPMDEIIGRELEILGTHGMAAHRFPALLDLIADGRLDPARLITRRIALDQVPDALMRMNAASAPGMTVMELN
jgi:alcohol dehydrogenase